MNGRAKVEKTVFILLLAALLLPGAANGATAKRTYASPEEAAAALAVAVKADNTAELRAILGPESRSLIESGDPVEDADDRAAFAAAYAEGHTLAAGEGDAGWRFLHIGQTGWPFPVPLAREAKTGRWYFDGKAGADVLLARRIGHNELSAIQVCLAYADAQREYRRLNPQKDPVPHFAAAIASTGGQRDGLYWESAPGEPASPLGALVAAAEAGGYAAPERNAAEPYFGYRYRVLTGQGEHAPSGSMDYRENGRMTRGFALLAYPERYGVSGIMTFMVSQDGVVFEKNLGRETAARAGTITTFDPDATWRVAEAR